MYLKKLLILGSGELGREMVISAKRLGCHVIAVDKYANAPAMQVADGFEVTDMLDGQALKAIIMKHQPDIIIPEIESIRTELLIELEHQGFDVTPNAQTTHMTMHRDVIRDFAANTCQLNTPKFSYAHDVKELQTQVHNIGLPCVIKPVMSSSGKGQSIVHHASEINNAWSHAMAGMRGDHTKVIVEAYIPFDYEITLLTIKQKNGPTLFLEPIGHQQQGGDYRLSWQPCMMSARVLNQAQSMAKNLTDSLGGAGLYGVEFFVHDDRVYFSEVSPRPHDTGMVTMISQNLNEFDLHIRAILGLPIPQIIQYGASASAVILAQSNGSHIRYSGIGNALKICEDVRIFAKPSMHVNRRMGVTLSLGKDIEEACHKASSASECITVTAQ